MAADELALARHLLGVDAADPVHPVGLGIGQLLPCIRFSARLDAARLGIALGALDARHLLSLGLELVLLDLLLLERPGRASSPPPAPWQR